MMHKIVHRVNCRVVHPRPFSSGILWRIFWKVLLVTIFVVLLISGGGSSSSIYLFLHVRPRWHVAFHRL